MLKRSPRNNSIRTKSSTKSNPSFTLKGGYLKMLNTTHNSNGEELLNTSITTRAPSISICTTYQPSLSRTPSVSNYNPNNITTITQNHNTTVNSELDERSEGRRTHMMGKKSLDYTNHTSSSVERRSSGERPNKLKRKTFVKHDPKHDEAPDMYEGPHTLESLFCQQPQELRLKLLAFLSISRLTFREIGSWSLEIDLIGG